MLEIKCYRYAKIYSHKNTRAPLGQMDSHLCLSSLPVEHVMNRLSNKWLSYTITLDGLPRQFGWILCLLAAPLVGSFTYVRAQRLSQSLCHSIPDGFLVFLTWYDDIQLQFHCSIVTSWLSDCESTPIALSTNALTFTEGLRRPQR